MATIRAIRESNAQFARAGRTGAVCVFAGATSGIGARTLERMLTMFDEATFYVVGRSEQRFAAQLKGLEAHKNPGCTIRFIEADVSLISGIDKYSKAITLAEKHVDYLCMSMGGVPVNGVECACRRSLPPRLGS
jgi:short-subunit dehydrogenase